MAKSNNRHTNVSEHEEPAPAPLIIGIGASAGGLEAFKTLFSLMPADSGMAFILVQHLDPSRPSFLVDLLSNTTQMIVTEAQDGARVTANRVYIIPPDATLTMDDAYLRVTRPAPPRETRRPIDTFFVSLAEAQGDNAVCVVLSGGGSDGSVGLTAIKEYGGLTLAQAEYDSHAMLGMPSNRAHVLDRLREVRPQQFEQTLILPFHELRHDGVLLGPPHRSTNSRANHVERRT